MCRGVLLLAVFATAGVSAAGGDDFSAAIKSGEPSLSIRYRYEFVDQDGFDEDANASTARLRFNYRSGQWKDWSMFLEFDHVFDVLVNDFDSGAGTTRGKSGDYPVVADPDGSDLNQLYLDYSSSDAWKWRFGRQRILLDNQRFVGGVGWRQNEQTYDSISLKTTAARNTTIFYSYVGQVRRIFGQTVDAGSNAVNAHLLNAKVGLTENWSITPYVYYIDNDDVAAFSTATMGARIAGNASIGDSKIALLAEFATQSDSADAPVDYDADYLHLNANWAAAEGFSLGLGFESLGGHSDPGGAFRTPLATLHAYNGWADKFLATPDAGLEDSYVTVKASAGKWNLSGVYHSFAAETGSSDYGSEIDVSAARKISERYGVLLKAAFFSADSDSSLTDTDKFWLMLTASY